MSSTLYNTYINPEHDRLISTNTAFDQNKVNDVLNTVSKLFNLRIPRLPIELGVSFLNVENDPQKGSRIGLEYILRKI